MKLVNLTSSAVRVVGYSGGDGVKVIPPSGEVLYLHQVQYFHDIQVMNIGGEDVAVTVYGPQPGKLPPKEDGVLYLVNDRVYPWVAHRGDFVTYENAEYGGHPGAYYLVGGAQ